MKMGLAVAIMFFMLIMLACDPPVPPVPPDPPDPDDLPQSAVATGGGWFETDDGKVTFGFNGHVDRVGDEYVYKGQIQFNDHDGGVNFHGKVEDGICIIDKLRLECTVTGTYRPQGKVKGDSGTFEMTAQDWGEPGASAGDHISILLTGGAYDGTSYDKTLGGGNIQVHVAE